MECEYIIQCIRNIKKTIGSDYKDRQTLLVDNQNQLPTQSTLSQKSNIFDLLYIS